MDSHSKEVGTGKLQIWGGSEKNDIRKWVGILYLLGGGGRGFQAGFEPQPHPYTLITLEWIQYYEIFLKNRIFNPQNITNFYVKV